jgi:hypothetical protein
MITNFQEQTKKSEDINDNFRLRIWGKDGQSYDNTKLNLLRKV